MKGRRVQRNQVQEGEQARADLDAASAVNLHEAKGSRLLLISRESRNCDVSACGSMRVDKVLVVHPVQVVSYRFTPCVRSKAAALLLLLGFDEEAICTMLC